MMENVASRSIESQGRRPSLETIRPWRKRTLQIISTEKWRKESEVTPLPQVAGHGSWDKSQAILTNKDGYILKPIQAGPRGEREIQSIGRSRKRRILAWHNFSLSYQASMGRAPRKTASS